MVFRDKKGFIRIEFEDSAYDVPQGYVEICLDFSLEDVGWGVVGSHYFSISAIENLSENLRFLLDGKVEEYHISEDDPELIPKPFYWLDFQRKGDKYLAHIKIHDCLMEYIEVTETIDKDKLRSIQEECRKAYEDRNNRSNYMKQENGLTTKAKMLIEWLIKLQLPKEKVVGILSILATDEQIDELMDWVEKNPAQLTMEWKKDMVEAATKIAVGREP